MVVLMKKKQQKGLGMENLGISFFRFFNGAGN
jgi:hypothetical protein